VDEVGVVHWEDCAASASAAEVDVDLEGDADVDGAVVKRYLLKILMQIWRSIIQKLCR
jgi:ABC-type maltose transport system permease subunit